MSGRRIAQVLGTTTGGIGTHVASLTRGLLDRGDRVSVYGPQSTNDQFGFSDAGARFVPIEFSETGDSFKDVSAVAHLRKALHGVGGVAPDVVHAHGLRAGLASQLAKPSASALVTSWHVHVSASGLKGKALQAAEMHVAHWSTVCIATEPDLVAHLMASRAKDARFIPVAAPELPAPTTSVVDVKESLDAVGRPLIVSVGRLHPVKRYDLLIDAAARWGRLPSRPIVAIAGDGPARSELERRIVAANAPVRLLGHRNDIADLINAADLAVVTSDSETRQLFTQEVLRSGTPLIATKVGGIPELVGDGASLIEPGNVDALDVAVRDLLDNADAAKELAEAGRRQASTWPTTKDTLDQLDALYKELSGR